MLHQRINAHRQARCARRAALAALLFAITAPVSARAQRIVGAGRIAALPAPVALDTTGRFQAAAVRVGDDMFISGQPTALALRELREQGVTTVINLRMQEELDRAVKFDEPATIASLGMQYVHIPMRGTPEAPYSPAAVSKLAEVLANAKGKVLLHCTVAWRASHLWAAYLIRERGVDVPTALTHTRAINLMDDMRMGPGPRQPLEDFLDRAVPQLRRPAPPPRPTINGGLPAVSPDGKWVAFVRDREGASGVYVIGADGRGERKLADRADGPVHWLPDGSGIYFGVGEFTADSSNLVKVPLGGGAPTLIERLPARDAVLTRDGQSVYATTGKWPDLQLAHIPLGSHEVHRLAKEVGPFFNTALSGDERVAIAHMQPGATPQVWLFAKGALKPLTTFTPADGAPQWPSWSPDGKTLVVQAGTYNARSPETNTAHLWRVDVATGAATKLAPHTQPYLDETPAYFPDGTRVAFQSNRTGRMEVWIMNADGSGATQLTK
jgi:uncharacterized protein (TIGR01244 family)